MLDRFTTISVLGYEPLPVILPDLNFVGVDTKKILIVLVRVQEERIWRSYLKGAELLSGL